MPKIGDYKYPAMKLSEALIIISKIINNFKGEITIDSLAQMLKMAKGGGAFIKKSDSLRVYGLVSGKSLLKTTNLAEAIILSPNPNEVKEAKANAYLNIPLIKNLLVKFNYKEVSKDDFKIGLRDVAGVPYPIVKDTSPRIIKLYNEALMFAKEKSGKTPEISYKLSDQETIESKEYIVASVGDIYIKVPKSEEQIQIAKKLLDMLESQSKIEKKEKPSKTEESKKE